MTVHLKMSIVMGVRKPTSFLRSRAGDLSRKCAELFGHELCCAYQSRVPTGSNTIERILAWPGEKTNVILAYRVGTNGLSDGATFGESLLASLR